MPAHAHVPEAARPPFSVSHSSNAGLLGRGNCEMGICCGALRVRCLYAWGIGLFPLRIRALRIVSLLRYFLFIFVWACRTALTFVFMSIKIHTLIRYSLLGL